MNLFYCSYPYGTASTSIFTGTFAWDKQWLSHRERDRDTEIERERGDEDRGQKEERRVGGGGENMKNIQIYMRFHAVSHVVQTKYKARVNWIIQRGTFGLHGCNTGSWMGERSDEPVMWACEKEDEEEIKKQQRSTYSMLNIRSHIKTGLWGKRRLELHSSI